MNERQDRRAAVQQPGLDQWPEWAVTDHAVANSKVRIRYAPASRRVRIHCAPHPRKQEWHGLGTVLSARSCRRPRPFGPMCPWVTLAPPVPRTRYRYQQQPQPLTPLSPWGHPTRRRFPDPPNPADVALESHASGAAPPEHHHRLPPPRPRNDQAEEPHGSRARGLTGSAAAHQRPPRQVLHYRDVAFLLPAAVGAQVLPIAYRQQRPQQIGRLAFA